MAAHAAAAAAPSSRKETTKVKQAADCNMAIRNQ